MIVSVNFLSHFWKNKFSIQEIECALIKSGVEIEAHEELVVPTNLCYGIVKSVKKIPDSKKLNLCEVFIPNTNENLNIICGASNVRVDLKVLVAKVNSQLFNKKILIEKKVIFGHESEGMICAFSELYDSKILKIPKKINLGIIELDSDWDCSKPFDPELLNLNDHIFDLSIPVNRKDLNCVWSLATEIQKNLQVEKQDISFYKLINDFSSWKIRSLLWNNNCFPLIQKDDTEASTENIIWEEKIQYLYLAFNELSTHSSTKTYKVYEKSSYFFNVLTMRYLQNHEPKVEHIPQPFKVNWDKIQDLFTQNNIKNEVQKYLTKAHFVFEQDTVIPPPWRNDLKNEGDFLNEVSIVVSLNDICPQSPNYISIPKIKHKNTEYEINKKISNFLINMGFIECITPNFQNHSIVTNYNIFNDVNIYKLSNPSSSKDSLRKHALIELLKIIEFNKKQKNEIFPIFEITKISEEEHHYWVCNMISVNDSKKFALNNTCSSNDIYDLMSIVKKMSFILGEKWEFECINKNNCKINDLFNQNTVSIMHNNKVIGYLGNLENQTLCNKDLKISSLRNNSVSCAIIKLNKFILESNIEQFCEVPIYPVSIKDISILMPLNESSDSNKISEDHQITIKQIIDLIKNVPYCVECKLTEKYLKHIVEKNEHRIVYLFRISLQSEKETLNKDQIQQSLNIITQKLLEHKMIVQ